MTTLDMDNFYVDQPDYFQLKELQTLFNNKEVTCERLILFTVSNKLSVNSYVKLSSGVYVPLVYRASLDKRHYQYFKWLVQQKANLNALPDNARDGRFHADSLLFVCCENLLPILINTAKLKLTTVHPREIVKRLKHGNIRRLQLLVRMGALGHDQIKQAVHWGDRNKIAFDALNILTEQIQVAMGSNNKHDHPPCHIAEIDAIIAKYRATIKFLNPNPYSLHIMADEQQITLLQFCANFYLHQIIAVMHIKEGQNRNPTITVPYHGDHSLLDKKIVAMFRPLLNDRNYVLTCDLVGLQPVAECF